MVRKAKELIETKGISSAPNNKPGKMLQDDKCEGLYYDDEISSCMPGKDNFASVKECGKKEFTNKNG
jgi:hypothetical protein